jgi:hypothetical protein
VVGSVPLIRQGCPQTGTQSDPATQYFSFKKLFVKLSTIFLKVNVVCFVILAADMASVYLENNSENALVKKTGPDSDSIIM